VAWFSKWHEWDVPSQLYTGGGIEVVEGLHRMSSKSRCMCLVWLLSSRCHGHLGQPHFFPTVANTKGRGSVTVSGQTSSEEHVSLVAVVCFLERPMKWNDKENLLDFHRRYPSLLRKKAQRTSAPLFVVAWHTYQSDDEARRGRDSGGSTAWTDSNS
jgi:hypothetical protein